MATDTALSYILYRAHVTSVDQGYVGTMVLYHPIQDSRGYVREQAFRDSCCNSVTDMYCNEYFGRRIINNCENYLPPVQGMFTCELCEILQ